MSHVLSCYRRAAGLSQAKFAERLKAAGFPATQALVSQWESGAVSISAERCVQVEQVTQGAVSRRHLRPDLFGPLAEAEDNDPHRRGAAEGEFAAQADAVPAPVSEAA